jgi:hypothetical protein
MIPIPARLRGRPRDARDFIVPYFVQWFEDSKPSPEGLGVPDFRVVNTERFYGCIKHNICWLCGGILGSYHSFVLGPMCAVTRTTSEPGSHRECAEYALKACPFLIRPRMRRNPSEYPGEVAPVAGFFLDHNPGIFALWISRQPAKPFKPEKGGAGVLLTVQDPVEVGWWKEGRLATREEVDWALEKGVEAALVPMAKKEGPAAEAALAKYVIRIQQYLPAR